MGLSGIHVWELVLVLVVVVLLFGSKKLPGIASDLGAALRGFRKSFSGDEGAHTPQAGPDPDQGRRDDDQGPPPGR